MPELISALGSTPIGILILGMIMGMMVLTWIISSKLTSFKYHEEQDRREFERVEKSFKEMEEKNRERTNTIHKLLNEFRDEVKKEISDARVEWAELAGRFSREERNV